MSMSPFEFRNAPEFFYSAAKSHHNIVWSEKATLYGRLVLAASGSEMQTATPIQCSLFTLSGDVMATSKLQEETRNRLRILFKGYDFIENYRPDWLRNPETGYPLEFDFWLPENQIAIEVQGQQHYKYTPHFHGSPENFQKQLKRDELKRQGCQEKGIYLYEIFDSEDIEQFLDKASQHSQELATRLKAKLLAIRELGFYAAQLWMEDRKDAPNPTAQDELIQKMARLAGEYQISLREIQPDFDTRKIDLQHSDYPVVGIVLAGPKPLGFYGVKALVLSVTDKEIHLKLARPKKVEDIEGGIFDARTGLQRTDSSSKWTIRIDCLDKIKDRYTDHQSGRVR